MENQSPSRDYHWTCQFSSLLFLSSQPFVPAVANLWEWHWQLCKISLIPPWHCSDIFICIIATLWFTSISWVIIVAHERNHHHQVVYSYQLSSSTSLVNDFCVVSVLLCRTTFFDMGEALRVHHSRTELAQCTIKLFNVFQVLLTPNNLQRHDN